MGFFVVVEYVLPLYVVTRIVDQHNSCGRPPVHIHYIGSVVTGSV